MKLVIMTRPTFFVEEDKIISALFDEGLDDLHLFKPGAPPVYMERLLSLLPSQVCKKITIHDHFYLKDDYSLAGIHLDDARQTPPVGYKGVVGRSCQDLSQLKAMKKESKYVFLRNLFNSQSEPEERSSFSMNELMEASRQKLIDKHVMALGGVNLDNLKTVRDLGFGGLVVCGDLWDKFDIHTQADFKSLLQYFARLRKAV